MRPLRGVEHEQAVAVLDRGVDGVGEQVAGAIERDVADAARAAGDARLRRSRRIDVEPARPGRRRCAPVRRPPPGAPPGRSRCAAAPAGLPPGAFRRPAAQEEVGRCWREGERADLLPRLHGAGREVAQLDAARRNDRGDTAASRGAPPRAGFAPAAWRPGCDGGVPVSPAAWPVDGHRGRRRRGGPRGPWRRCAGPRAATECVAPPCAAATGAGALRGARDPPGTRSTSSPPRTSPPVASATVTSSFVSRFRMCRTGFDSAGNHVRELQRVGHPLAVTGDLRDR